MADSKSRVVIALDASEHSDKAFHCKYLASISQFFIVHVIYKYDDQN